MRREDDWTTSEAAAGEFERNQHDPREKNEAYEPDAFDEREWRNR